MEPSLAAMEKGMPPGSEQMQFSGHYGITGIVSCASNLDALDIQPTGPRNKGDPENEHDRNPTSIDFAHHVR